MKNIDLWNEQNNLKGRISEFIVQSQIKRLILTRSKWPDDFFTSYPKTIPPKIKKFLQKFWHSIDLFKLEYNTNKEITNLTIYEVKTKKYLPKLNQKYSKYGLMNITQNTLLALEEANKNGFNTYIAIVRWFFRWQVGVQIKTFEESKSMFKLSNG